MDIGPFIREQVLPHGMPVTEAAKRLGVARSTLSRLLNGHASLSSEMALRLEQVFNADRQELLDLQTQAVGTRANEESRRSAAPPPYAPPFLPESITARRISEWAAGNISAQAQLPVLVRRLINSTGRDLRRVDFPGGDNSQRHGWDGWVEADTPTQRIPEGKSGWELSTEQRPSRKANDDYADRLAIDAGERAACTFVFVTTCIWPRKKDWERRKEALGEWKAVRAFDASDLEQWLEDSISGQVWLAKELGMPTSDIETLDQIWAEWAAGSEPPMTSKIFEPSLVAYHDKFKAWLENKPTDRPFTVAADSKHEALVFIACLFEHGDAPLDYGRQAAVVNSAQTLKTLAASPSSFTPIVCDAEVERKLATLYRQRHCIAVRPRNAVGRELDIALEILGYEAFEAALADMGIARDDFPQWARESGRSPTVLRRRLSKIQAIRTPGWAKKPATARRLIPIVLVGAWHTESEADREILAKISGGSYSKVEETITDLRLVEDPPVWSVSRYCGVVSKIDALFAISESLREKDLREFLKLAKCVLSERDPSLDLPEDQRWAAAVYDKVRNHSHTLRSGICETLVLLSVHGTALFQNCPILDVEWLVSSLIRDLLDPLTIDTLLSHERDLPHYAEAAPAEFLSLLEDDLRQPDPVLLGLLKPADSGVFSNCPRTGLLWALECIAWNPKYLARVTLILAQLSKVEINDNWANTPIASLESIYRCWFPQTAASLDYRIRGLEMLVQKFPGIGWEICMQQFGSGPQMAKSSYRPRWRADATGAGKVKTDQEPYNFARRALDLALTWPEEYDSSKLGDLIERLNLISPGDRTAVWNLIETWSHSKENELEKARLRDKIWRVVLAKRKGRFTSDIRDLALAAYEELTPCDVVLRHSWLFASDWVDVPEDEWIKESATSNDEKRFDFDKEEEWVHVRRTEAMEEIWAERGLDGIVSLLKISDAAFIVGRYAALTLTSLGDACSALQGCLSAELDPQQRTEAFMRGLILEAIGRQGSALLSQVSETATSDQKVRLFTCAPFSSQTWRILDQEKQSIRDGYWRDVPPHRNRHSEIEVNELLDRLLDAERPWEAFHAVEWEWKKIETSRFKRLMIMLATSDDKSDYRYRPDSFYIAHALKALDVRADVAENEMAQLELLFINALDDDDEYGIPNLERHIEDSPALFVQCLALLFKRGDDGQDPPSWQIKNSDQRTAAATNAYRLLRRLRRIPGTETHGNISTEKLRLWVTEVRRLCAEHGRAEVGDHQIGQFLINAPSDEDGVWPCRSVCEVMESVQSEQIAYGFHLGVNNARGVHLRGEGGDQERELSAKYRELARRVDFEFPYVSSVLERIAKGYGAEARREDSDADVRRRLIL